MKMLRKTTEQALAHGTQAAMIKSLLRQNGVSMSFWRNNDVIIASRAHWEVASAWA